MNSEQQALPRVTIVIPIFNNASMLDDCLRTLLPQDYPDYEVIVVDDGSSDNPAAVADRYPVRLLTGPHLGISAARNRAIREASGEIILLVDSDLKAPKDLASRMVKPLLAEPELAVTMAWWDISNPDNLVADLSFRVYEYWIHPITEPDFFFGYCFAIWKEVFSQIGYFDESLPLVEDVDFAYRLVHAGRRIRILKDVRVWHYFRDSLKRHLERHFKTARHKFLYVKSTGRFTDNRGTRAEYAKLALHLFTVLSIAALPWRPEIFFVLLALSLLSHLKITLWSMKKGARYALVMPFEFLTKTAWALGVLQGAFWIARGYRVHPRNL